MTSLILGLFFQFLSSADAAQNAPVLCADPSVFHSSILLSICHENASPELTYGVCWSENPEPTIFDAFFLFKSNESSFEFRIMNLKPQTNYQLRFFSLEQNGIATYYAPLQIETIRKLEIGDYYQGGVICYLFKPEDSLYVDWEQHGLIISKEDLGHAAWGMHGQPIADSTSVALGQGSVNTAKIVRQLGTGSASFYAPITSGLRIVHPSAALLCRQYISDGYDDWFLPSKNEWYTVFLKYDSLLVLGLSTSEDYWSSSEVYLTWRFKKDKPRHTKYHHKRAWQTRIRSQSLILYTMSPKKTAILVRAMRYF